MDFFEAIKKRRSIRRYTEEPVPDDVIEKALDAAILAPNSSNTQTWDFYWVQSPLRKKQLVEACFSQSAARKAQHLIVVTANPGNWRRSYKPLSDYARKIQAPQAVQLYYDKLVPYTNRLVSVGVLSPALWIAAFVAGLFRPVPRGPFTRAGRRVVAIKSAALACQNFMLAITAQGYASCPMEGFDNARARRAVGLSCSDSIVMVISVGREAVDGTWGPQYRLPREQVIHRV